MTDAFDHDEPTAGFVVGASRPAGHAATVLHDEVFHAADLSAGVYSLPAGAHDPQDPHTEDEVYVVLGGKAALEIDGTARPVGPGSVAYVPATVQHRFVQIEESLQVVVVFGPAEHSRSPTGDDRPHPRLTGR